ncbi:hypothetical protein K438DRAFT_1983771 [Mycena galopus ATCC 62051]|nr:hypothetical protein K438DRAFT_1983771 [Mycena galopus ATCC 62051]
MLAIWLLLLIFEQTVVLALTSTEIINSLNSLTSLANQTTCVFNEIIAQTGDVESNVLRSKRMLDELTIAYLAFAADVASDPGSPVLNATVTAVVLQAANLHSTTFSTMGIALARSLPTYYNYNNSDYLDGCNDGVEIGLHAITLFIDLALKFTSGAVALALDGLLTVVRVPLAQLSALGCFVPELGPLPLLS